MKTKLSANESARIAANVSTWGQFFTPSPAWQCSTLAVEGRAQSLRVAVHTDPECPRTTLLSRAVAAGADNATLAAVRDANRVSSIDTIVLPAHRYEGLSRGRGWARSGKGVRAVWGERVEKGYRVGPGKWSVGATDGFNRKDSAEWTVSALRVGDQTWTIAN